MDLTYGPRGRGVPRRGPRLAGGAPRPASSPRCAASAAPAASTRPTTSASPGTGTSPRHGWTCLGWPEEHGGRGLPLFQQVIFHEEYARADAPARVNHLGEELLGPTLIAFGTAGAAATLPAEDRRRSRSCGARATPSPAPAPTSPTSRPRRGSTATTVGHRRPEGVDLARPRRPTGASWSPHRARLEAPPRPVLPARADGPGRRRGPPDRPAHRHLGVQRGLLHRRAHRRPTWWSASPARAGGSRWARSASSAASPRSASRSASSASSTRCSTSPASNGAYDDPVIHDRLARAQVDLEVMRLQRAAQPARQRRRRRAGQASISKLLWASWHRTLGELAMHVRGRRTR